MRVSASTTRVLVAFSMVNLVFPLCISEGGAFQNEAVQNKAVKFCTCSYQCPKLQRVIPPSQPAFLCSAIGARLATSVMHRVSSISLAYAGVGIFGEQQKESLSTTEVTYLDVFYLKALNVQVV